jgi:hypothetical protein
MKRTAFPVAATLAFGAGTAFEHVAARAQCLHVVRTCGHGTSVPVLTQSGRRAKKYDAVQQVSPFSCAHQIARAFSRHRVVIVSMFMI